MGYRRILLCVTFPWILVASASGQRNAQPDSSRLRVTSSLVFLDVTVLDKKGHPVDGLTKDDFTITEEKHPQRIFSFEAPAEHLSAKNPAAIRDYKAPVTIIVLDLLNSNFEDFAFIRYSVRKFLLGQPERLSSATELLVISNNTLDVLQSFTRNRNNLLQALIQLPPVLPYKRMNESFFWERFVQSLDALQQVALQNTGIQGRKNVIWVGHGGPNISLDPLFFPVKTEEKLKQYVHSTANLLVNARVSLFVIYPGLKVSAPTMPLAAAQARVDVGETDPFAGDVNFGLFVNETGGKLFFDRNDIDAEIGQSEQLGSNYYTLTYQPQDTKLDGKFRRIRVQLRDPSYRVVTKAGYYAHSANESADPLQKLMVDLSEAIHSTIPYQALDVTISNVVRHPDSRTVEFSVSLKSKGLNFVPGDDGKNAAQVIAAAASLDQNRSLLAARRRRIRLSFPTNASSHPPDVAWQTHFTLPLQRRTTAVRLAMVDEDGDRLGTAEIDRKSLLSAPEQPTLNPPLIPAEKDRPGFNQR